MKAHQIIQRLTDADDTHNICLTVVLRGGEHEIETLLQREGQPTWSLCGGLQEDDETSEEAAARQLREESGIDTPVERLVELEKHCLRQKPAKVFYAVVDSGAKAKAGDAATDLKWVPITALHGLNTDDKCLIEMAVKRVYDPESLVREAIEENAHRYPVGNLAANIAPRGTKGVLIVLEGTDLSSRAKALAEHIRQRGQASCVVSGHLSLIGETALDSAHRLRRLNSLTEAIIKAADALHRWETQVKPALDAGQFVICEHWVDHDRKTCLKRGLEPELFEALFRFLPKPNIEFYLCEETPDEVIKRFDTVAEAEPPFNPENYFSDFVNKDLGVSFLIHKGGDDNVFGSEPFRYAYLAYSNDPIPAPEDRPEWWEGQTRTFEGYLWHTPENKWLAVLNGKAVTASIKANRPLDQAWSDEFDLPEQAAYALYRYNRK